MGVTADQLTSHDENTALPQQHFTGLATFHPGIYTDGFTMVSGLNLLERSVPNRQVLHAAMQQLLTDITDHRVHKITTASNGADALV